MIQSIQNSPFTTSSLRSEQRNAYQTIRKMLAVEKTLVAYESYALMQQETWQRIGDLLVLDAWYQSNFGVAFQQRHDFRSKLFEVINKKACSKLDSKKRKHQFEQADSISPMIIRN